mmetsp:Transcript_35851/g.80760  ORF Transcript_35851/g.80760 Transcript_35851/m.80760 type:complete len:620 (+) Transcript_35851:58-1917(+)
MRAAWQVAACWAAGWPWGDIEPAQCTDDGVSLVLISNLSLNSASIWRRAYDRGTIDSTSLCPSEWTDPAQGDTTCQGAGLYANATHNRTSFNFGPGRCSCDQLTRLMASVRPCRFDRRRCMEPAPEDLQELEEPELTLDQRGWETPRIPEGQKAAAKKLVQFFLLQPLLIGVPLGVVGMCVVMFLKRYNAKALASYHGFRGHFPPVRRVIARGWHERFGSTASAEVEQAFGSNAYRLVNPICSGRMCCVLVIALTLLIVMFSVWSASWALTLNGWAGCSMLLDVVVKKMPELTSTGVDVSTDAKWAIVVGNPTAYNGIHLGDVKVTVYHSPARQVPLAVVKADRPRVEPGDRVVLIKQRLLVSNQSLTSVTGLASSLVYHIAKRNNFTFHVSVEAEGFYFQGWFGTWSLHVHDLECAAPLWFAHGLKVLGVGLDSHVATAGFVSAAVTNGLEWYWDTQGVPCNPLTAHMSGSIPEFLRILRVFYIILFGSILAQGIVAFFCLISSMLNDPLEAEWDTGEAELELRNFGRVDSSNYIPQRSQQSSFSYPAQGSYCQQPDAWQRAQGSYCQQPEAWQASQGWCQWPQGSPQDGGALAVPPGWGQWQGASSPFGGCHSDDRW